MAAERPVLASVGGLLLLGAGFGLGLLVGESAAPPVVVAGSAVEAPEAAGVPASPPSSPVLPGADAPSPAPEVPRGGSERLSSDFRESIRALLESIPEPAAPTGTGAIRGFVQAEDGTPLAGVEVTCSPVHPSLETIGRRRRGDPPSSPEPVDTAILAFREARFLARPKWRTTTSAMGEFRFEGLADVRHVVRARSRGWTFDVFQGQDDPRPGEQILFRGERRVEVWFEFVDAAGAELDGVHLEWTAPHGSGNAMVSLANPSMRLRPGPYEFRAHCPDHDAESLKTDVPADVEAPLIRIVLPAKRP
jgi:hypothetical protein